MHHAANIEEDYGLSSVGSESFGFRAGKFLAAGVGRHGGWEIGTGSVPVQREVKGLEARDEKVGTDTIGRAPGI